ncbi:MAG: M23 family metallopeptidase [Balneolaceae bacterium]|nr:M23 family metallopeptidase [Balneolaceae bacterium]
MAQKTLAQNNSVNVTTNRVGNSLKIVAYNDNPHSITLTVNISGSNFKPRKHLPVQVVLSAKSKETVLSVDKKNENEGLQVSISSEWVVGNVNASHDDSYVYRLPYQNNQSFKVGQSHNGSFSHTGNWQYSIDFMMPTGTPILAARGGVVARTEEGYSEGGPSKEYEDKANYIYIEHADGTFGEYAHLQRNGVLVNPGTRVQKGQVIGISGNTGFSSGPHLHFSVSRVISGGSYRSLPVKIKTSKGVFVRLQKGVEYTPR